MSLRPLYASPVVQLDGPNSNAPVSRLLTKSASGVLASFRSSTYPRGYASGLHSPRPCWTAFLNNLRGSQKESGTFRRPCFLCTQVVCQQPVSLALGIGMCAICRTGCVEFDSPEIPVLRSTSV